MKLNRRMQILEIYPSMHWFHQNQLYELVCGKKPYNNRGIYIDRVGSQIILLPFVFAPKSYKVLR